MEAAGDHSVPSGPLAVRWLAYDAGRPRAGALGAARLAFENAGTVPWPPTGERRAGGGEKVGQGGGRAARGGGGEARGEGGGGVKKKPGGGRAAIKVPL